MMLKTCVRLLLIVVLSAGASARAATVASWTFDQFDGQQRQIESDQGSGLITLAEAWVEAGLSNPKGTVVNSPNEVPEGSAMGLSGMARNGQFFELSLPKSGHGDLHVSAALRRSASGYTAVIISRSIDGGKTFEDLEAWAPTGTWSRHALDLGQVPSEGRTILRFTMDGATSARGTIAFDNLIVARQVSPSVRSREADRSD